MARTDKDRPEWVRADDPLEDREETHYHVSYGGEPRECDLHVSAKDKHGRYSGNCGYWLPYSVYRGGPPAWFRRARWHAPERCRERDQLGELAKLFRGGNQDLDFANFQHRHGAARDWW